MDKRTALRRRFDKLNSKDFQVKSVRIYSRLSIKPMITGHRGNQIGCRGREIFVGPNLVMQWVPGNGKVVWGYTKMSPGKVSPGVLQRGVLQIFAANMRVIFAMTENPPLGSIIL